MKSIMSEYCVDNIRIQSGGIDDEAAANRLGCCDDTVVEFMQSANRFFCGNDRTAMGCYSALFSLGLRIPDDVAVIGFDNQRDIADGLWPPLTTIQLPHYEMGKWAVEYLMSAKPSPQNSIQYMVDCPLVERSSVQHR
jgi:LacI family transcriptional regulator